MRRKPALDGLPLVAQPAFADDRLRLGRDDDEGRAAGRRRSPEGALEPPEKAVVVVAVRVVPELAREPLHLGALLGR